MREENLVVRLINKATLFATLSLAVAGLSMADDRLKHDDTILEYEIDRSVNVDHLKASPEVVENW
jgi:hypothetical protein